MGWRSLWNPSPGWYVAWGAGDRGDGERFHRHTVNQTFTVISGEIVVKIGEDLRTLRAGESTLAPSRLPHGLVLLEASEYVSVFFESDGLIDVPRIRREQVPSISRKEAEARRALLDQGRIAECFEGG